MPHFALHILLASRVAEAGDGQCPELKDPAWNNAFLHGSIGPDMGFFPGGEHLLSMAAHAVRSGDLARRLHATAETPEQWAFARGWLTHMIGDILIHPLINRAAAAQMERECTAATMASHRNAHIRIELGLDTRYVARLDPGTTRLRPFFDAATARWIQAAFRKVHGVQLETRAILRSHHQVVRLQRPLRLLERLLIIGNRPGHPLRHLVLRGLLASEQLARWRLGASSTAAAFLGALRPSGSLVATVDEIIREFPTSFTAFSRLILEGGMNYSLDRGGVEVPGRPTPEAIAASQRLAAIRLAQAASADSERNVA